VPPSSNTSEWVRRFTAPQMSFPRWSPAAPDRCISISNESGIFQAWTWDAASGERRRASDEPVGVESAFTTPDGTHAVWWVDRTGDERGRWVIAPFAGGATRPLREDLPDAWGSGVSLADGVIAVGLSDEDHYSVWIARDGGPARPIAEQAEFLGVGNELVANVGGLSSDGNLLCLIDGKPGDIQHLALRVVAPDSGATVGELFDGRTNLTPVEWSPIRGDQRLLLLSEPTGMERPAVWNLTTGERRELALDLTGPVEWGTWWPDASALVLLHRPDGRAQLLHHDLATGETRALTDPAGDIEGFGVRPDGTVWMHHSSGAEPGKIVAVGGSEIVAPEGERAPAGLPLRSLEFENPGGQRVHGFLAVPEGDGPFPTVMMVHGGPEWAYPDAFEPWTQALVEHGYAVAQVNYRGSTGYGVAWRQALIGNIGFPEVEDVLAGLDALIERGVADPDRVAIEGWSWGGYISLLAIGLHPGRFRAAIGGIPVGDNTACHYECAPALQAYDIAMMGGTPEEKPELYRERSPLTYAGDAARTPTLVIAGENDSRCPIGQVRWFVDAVRVRGGDIRLHTYDSGHHANATDELLLHAELELAFLAEHVPSAANPRTTD
jgi:dienelactone hydrolase